MGIIKRALDVGARSLLIPFVQNAEEARKAVAATRYPPAGHSRCLGRATRQRLWPRAKLSQERASRYCVLVQLETRAALRAH